MRFKLQLTVLGAITIKFAICCESSMKRIFTIYHDFSQAMKEDGEDNDPSHFFSEAATILDECTDYVRKKYSVQSSVPNPPVQLCSSREFEQLLANRLWFGQRPTAFRDTSGLIAINVGGILESAENLETFVGNFVLNVLEELIHWVFPNETERDIKVKTYDAAEEYLQYPIPSSYKEDSLKRAENPDY